MSNARTHRRRLGRLVNRASAEQVDQAVAVGCWLRGCTCQPDISTRHHSTGVTRVAIAHDAWCPALKQGDKR